MDGLGHGVKDLPRSTLGAVGLSPEVKRFGVRNPRCSEHVLGLTLFWGLLGSPVVTGSVVAVQLLGLGEGFVMGSHFSNLSMSLWSPPGWTYPHIPEAC